MSRKGVFVKEALHLPEQNTELQTVKCFLFTLDRQLQDGAASNKTSPGGGRAVPGGRSTNRGARLPRVRPAYKCLLFPFRGCECTVPAALRVAVRTPLVLQEGLTKRSFRDPLSTRQPTERTGLPDGHRRPRAPAAAHFLGVMGSLERSSEIRGVLPSKLSICPNH